MNYVTSLDLGHFHLTNAVFGENELQEGSTRRVEVEGVPVIVSRSEGSEPSTIANTCTHRGGPGLRELRRTPHGRLVDSGQDSTSPVPCLRDLSSFSARALERCATSTSVWSRGRLTSQSYEAKSARQRLRRT
jgi:nitrite reductase/ring-hydroxylating ferredoxin subunit